MTKIFKTGALVLAASGMALGAVPAEARHYDRDGYAQYERGGYDARYGEPVDRDTHVWRGRDGQYYCRHKDGTTGLIVGAAAGALLGNAVAGYRDRGLGTIIGGALGAIVGKQVAQGSRCR